MGAGHGSKAPANDVNRASLALAVFSTRRRTALNQAGR